MTGMSAYRVSPRQATQFIMEIMDAGLVPFLRSSPAMGKSSILQYIADAANLKLIDIRLSTCAPEDLTGLPFFANGKAQFMPFDIFPIEGTEYPINPKTGEPYAGWLVFFDEFNSASKMVQAAAYKVLLDKKVNQSLLHKDVVMCCAGNLDTDRAITNQIGTALQSRLIHLEMQLVKDSQGLYSEFMQDVAFKYDWDERVIAYLNYAPDRLHDFKPDHNDKTFCAPRTWDFVQKLVKGKKFGYTTDRDGNQIYEMTKKAPLYAGAITSGAAIDFVNFTKNWLNLPKLEDILADPYNAPIPFDPPVRFSTVTMLIGRTTTNNFGHVANYINRFPAEMRTLFFRGLLVQKPELHGSAPFRSAMVELARYLYD